MNCWFKQKPSYNKPQLSQKIWQVPSYSLYPSLTVQLNLYKTSTLGTLKLWALLTGVCCSEIALCYENGKWNLKRVVVEGRSLFGGGRWIRFDSIQLFINQNFIINLKIIKRNAICSNLDAIC
jgi:hypothetical protein